MRTIHRIKPGYYVVEHCPYENVNLYITKSGNFWYADIDHGMTKFWANTLKQIKEQFNIK